MVALLGGLLGLVILVIIIGIAMFNGMVSLKVRAEGAWSDVDVILKKRYNLIPNLVETIKGATKFESETLEKVIKARQQCINVSADDVESKIKAENMLASTLRSMYALTENYPDLKSNADFKNLMEQLQKIETEIERARRYYNAVIRDYTTKTMKFPGSIVAGMGNFSKMPFYEVEEAEMRENVNVKF